ncbi:hypothetical protein [Paenibacillus pedocola]|uniref:hypothetical protein n=1 Tax=Paenibacillus pedocola TaxID=3242193 RepID=UPI002877B9B1|nr:hypothetical protein [Paenibacillus typhae]
MSEIPAGRRGIFAKELFATTVPVRAAIQEAADRGFDGLYLGSPSSISPEPDRKELEEAGQFAKRERLHPVEGTDRADPQE